MRTSHQTEFLTLDYFFKSFNSLCGFTKNCVNCWFENSSSGMIIIGAVLDILFLPYFGSRSILTEKRLINECFRFLSQGWKLTVRTAGEACMKSAQALRREIDGHAEGGGSGGPESSGKKKFSPLGGCWQPAGHGWVLWELLSFRRNRSRSASKYFQNLWKAVWLSAASGTSGFL